MGATFRTTLDFFMGQRSQFRRNLSQALPELLSLVRGDLPRFIYGSDIHRDEIPVFSFHSIDPVVFRKLLVHLRKNGYSTINMTELLEHLEGIPAPGIRRVALTFDDGWSTAWTVATPLLKEFGMKATLFLAPSTIMDGTDVRKTIDDGASDDEVAAQDRFERNYLVSWAEVDAMQRSDVWDIQSHTLFHTRVWRSDRVEDFACPQNRRNLKHYRPGNNMIGSGDEIIALSELPLGWPIYPDAARMSAIQRFIPDPQEGPTLVEFVAVNGGEKFFELRKWRNQLKRRLGEFRKSFPGRWESADEMAECLEYELRLSKEILESRTGHCIEHLLFPWEEGSDLAIGVAKSLGYRSACWGTLKNRRSNYPGEDPFMVPRLSWKFLPMLPGDGRASLFAEIMRRIKNRTRAMFQ